MSSFLGFNVCSSRADSSLSSRVGAQLSCSRHAHNDSWPAACNIQFLDEASVDRIGFQLAGQRIQNAVTPVCVETSLVPVGNIRRTLIPVLVTSRAPSSHPITTSWAV
jgi:hypothetical protein